MDFQPNYLYHVYNRGNNKRQLFFKRSHYFRFLHKVEKELLPYSEILAYCLMPTHYHFLILAKEYDLKEGFKTYLGDPQVFHPLTRKIGSLQSSFSRLLNLERNESGSHFQQKAKAKLLNTQDHYPLICFHYIHQNPIRANLVRNMEHWEFSSYPDYAGMRIPYLINKQIAQKWLDLPDQPDRFIKESKQFISDQQDSIDVYL